MQYLMYMQELRADLQLREIQLSEELQSKEAEISRLREEPRKGEMVCILCERVCE